MKNLPEINRQKIDNSEGIERNLLYLIRSIQEQEKIIELCNTHIKELNNTVKERDEKIHLLRNELKQLKEI
jgi:uncharacterized coiled-coil protein SlyX